MASTSRKSAPYSQHDGTVQGACGDDAAVSLGDIEELVKLSTRCEGKEEYRTSRGISEEVDNEAIYSIGD